MKHFASSKFWLAYEGLPQPVRELADKNYALLKADPYHPSLALKKVGRFWSTRVGIRHRALAIEVEDGSAKFIGGIRTCGDTGGLPRSRHAIQNRIVFKDVPIKS
jgi:hypothetical protein